MVLYHEPVEFRAFYWARDAAGPTTGPTTGPTQGLQQGEAQMLLRLLERKFGEVLEAVRQRIEVADAETLLEWSERVLTAPAFRWDRRLEASSSPAGGFLNLPGGESDVNGITLRKHWIEPIMKSLETLSPTIVTGNGKIKELPGVWATGKTLEDCRRNLKDTVEGWLLLSVKKGLPVPKLGVCEIKEGAGVII
jgi:predicted RNase H-like HicB family nuclease